MTDVNQLGDQLAGAAGVIELEVDFANLFTSRAALASQLLQAPHPPLVACAARLYAFADPDLFLSEQFVKTSIGQLLGVEPLLLVGLPFAEVARKAQELAAIKLDDARGHGIEKPPIVGDEKHAAAPGHELLLEPGNPIKVEVVGGFIKQQELWFT